MNELRVMLELMYVLVFLLLADWRARFQAGETHLQGGEIEQARKAFAGAYKEADGAAAEESAAIVDALGRTQFAAGRFRQAQHWFEKAVAGSAGHPASQAAALGNLARTHIAAGDFAAALAAARQAVTLSPLSASLWQLQGQAAFRRGDLAAAKASLQKAISLGGGSMVLADLALIAELPALLEEALRDMPAGQARARALANLGLMRWRAGERREAAVHLKQALGEMERAVGPNHPDVTRLLSDYAEVLERTGRKAEARAMARRAALGLGGATVDWRDLR